MQFARSGDLGANEIIRLLDLKPHPEGGHFAETYREAGTARAHSTAIYYLLQADELSAWHRVDADDLESEARRIEESGALASGYSTCTCVIQV